MTTNNSLNQATEYLLIAPIGTSSSGQTSGLQIRKDQAGTTGMAILNETNNASASVAITLKQLMNNSGTPKEATAGISLFNDQAGGGVGGWLVIQSDANGPSGNEPINGIILYGAQPADIVKVATGASVITQATWNATGGQYRGYNSNTAPPAGYLGESIIATISNGTPTTVNDNTVTNLTSIALTAGIWDISCVACFSGALTGTASAISISTANNTLGTIGNARIDSPTTSSAASDYCMTIPAFRVSLSANTNYYLNVLCKFTVGTCTSYGRISATRVA